MPAPRLLQPPERSVRLAARGVIALALAIVLWALVREPWAAVFRAAGNLIAVVAGAGERIVFGPASGAPGSVRRGTGDTLVRLFDADHQRGFDLLIDAAKMSYVPCAVFLGLAFVARAGRRRLPLRDHALGLAATGAFVVASTALTVLRGVLQAPSLGIYRPGPAATLVIDLAARVTTSPGFEYVVPAFLWCLGLALKDARLRPPSTAPAR